jgi:hypothetical protein
MHGTATSKNLAAKEGGQAVRSRGESLGESASGATFVSGIGRPSKEPRTFGAMAIVEAADSPS